MVLWEKAETTSTWVRSAENFRLCVDSGSVRGTEADLSQVEADLRWPTTDFTSVERGSGWDFRVGRLWDSFRVGGIRSELRRPP